MMFSIARFSFRVTRAIAEKALRYALVKVEHTFDPSRKEKKHSCYAVRDPIFGSIHDRDDFV